MLAACHILTRCMGNASLALFTTVFLRGIGPPPNACMLVSDSVPAGCCPPGSGGPDGRLGWVNQESGGMGRLLCPPGWPCNVGPQRPSASVPGSDVGRKRMIRGAEVASLGRGCLLSAIGPLPAAAAPPSGRHAIRRRPPLVVPSPHVFCQSNSRGTMPVEIGQWVGTSLRSFKVHGSELIPSTSLCSVRFQQPIPAGTGHCGGANHVEFELRIWAVEDEATGALRVTASLGFPSTAEAFMGNVFAGSFFIEAAFFLKGVPLSWYSLAHGSWLEGETWSNEEAFIREPRSHPTYCSTDGDTRPQMLIFRSHYNFGLPKELVNTSDFTLHLWSGVTRRRFGGSPEALLTHSFGRNCSHHTRLLSHLDSSDSWQRIDGGDVVRVYCLDDISIVSKALLCSQSAVFTAMFRPYFLVSPNPLNRLLTNFPGGPLLLCSHNGVHPRRCKRDASVRQDWCSSLGTARFHPGV